MKLDYVEVSGFRGFRDKLRVDFGSGFTVICGRNGVGKSTLCDAIEFAVMGEIDKYRVEKAAKENFNDYVWWRGQGSPNSHYVSVGFLGNDAKPFSITRSREGGADKTANEVELALCTGAMPDSPLRQLCRTSIIRDEWIAALSLDLSETERFDLVRAALGAVEGADYLGRAKTVLAITESNASDANERYKSACDRLNAALARLAEARARVVSADDIASAVTRLDAAGAPANDDLIQRIAAARQRLFSDKLRISRMADAVSEARELRREIDELAGPVFRQQMKDSVERAGSTRQALHSAATAVERTRRRQEAAQEADALASSLAILVEHGSRLGLDEGKCPLCASPLIAADFERGLALARERIAKRGSEMPAALRELEETEQHLARLTEELADADSITEGLSRREEAVRKREATQSEVLRQNGFDSSLATDPDRLEVEFYSVRDRLVELERALLTLEASRAVEGITDLEGQVSSLREQVAANADRLGRVQLSVTAAKSIEHGVRRVTAELIDERLALISPLLNELYQRLRPHADWKSIEYGIRGDVRRFLSLRVGDGLNPQFVFSSGQRRAAGLAFLLSVHLARSWCRLQTLVLDDPVQHIDDFRALHLVEVLAALRQDDRQIICTVEDASLADLLCRRLFSTTDGPGVRYDLDMSATGSPEIARKHDIAPMPLGVLRLVAASA